MSENSTRPHSEKGVGPARRPSTRRIGASGLRNKPKWRSMRLKLPAIWRMSVSMDFPDRTKISPSRRPIICCRDGYSCCPSPLQTSPSTSAAPRRLSPRSIRKLCGGQCKLQLLEHDRPIGKFARLLEYLVGTRLNVDIMIFRKSRLAAIKRVRRQRRSHKYPLTPVVVFGQDQITRGGVFWFHQHFRENFRAEFFRCRGGFEFFG